MDQKRKTTMAEDAAERDVTARWGKDAALRAEFRDDFDSCRAYHQAVARGNAKHTKANVKSLGVIEDARPAASMPAGDPNQHAHAVAVPAMRPGLSEEEMEKALRQRWNADAALRAEFAEDFEIFEAFATADAAGRLKILGQPSARPRDVGSAVAPLAVAVASATDTPFAGSVVYGGQEYRCFDDFFVWRRGFAARQIEEGRLNEAIFRGNLVTRWNEMARQQGRN